MNSDHERYISAKDARCDHPPSDALLAALDQFNRQEWFECHEILEELWAGTEGEIRDFYQGVLQVAVALYHWENGNLKGAISLLQGGCDLLRRVRPVCQRVDVTSLVAGVDLLREELTRLGQGRMVEVDQNLFPKMRLAGK